MAVAWIACLDLDEVREWSANYRVECFDWRWQRWRVWFSQHRCTSYTGSVTFAFGGQRS